MRQTFLIIRLGALVRAPAPREANFTTERLHDRLAAAVVAEWGADLNACRHLFEGGLFEVAGE